MYLEELRKIVNGDKKVQDLLKKRKQAEEKKANALTRLGDIADKRREKKGQDYALRSRMTTAILEGKDPEALHREEKDIAVSLESLERWSEEIENEIIPELTGEITALTEELKETVRLLLVPCREKKRDHFEERLEQVGIDLEAFEKALRDVTAEIGAYVQFNALHLRSRILLHRIGPY